jgi:ribosome maturation factor RimP
LVERVESLAAPLVSAAALDLVEVQLRGEGPRRLVRIVVDRKGGVDVAGCTAVSRALRDQLDQLPEFETGFSLEVTSPGIDAPLRDRRAFERVEGRTVLVHQDLGDGNLTQLRGTVISADEQDLVLDIDGAPLRVPYNQIAKATQSLPW